MKIITISKVGYNHPSQANWSWGIWKLDTIDTEKEYCMSYTIKENFGGETRLKRKVEDELNHKIIETKGVYTDTGTQKITGINKLMNAEEKEIFEIIKEFLTDK